MAELKAAKHTGAHNARKGLHGSKAVAELKAGCPGHGRCCGRGGLHGSKAVAELKGELHDRPPRFIDRGLHGSKAVAELKGRFHSRGEVFRNPVSTAQKPWPN